MLAQIRVLKSNFKAPKTLLHFKNGSLNITPTRSFSSKKTENLVLFTQKQQNSLFHKFKFSSGSSKKFSSNTNETGDKKSENTTNTKSETNFTPFFLSLVKLFEINSKIIDHLFF